ncbi:hypothetical protein [Streptomyces sp. NPDC051546]|uniref:hypothetical protein n=1 Tax=Streptomyces sp. NPDC051546 TaxID=3365655 RepID=UPI0037AAA2B0
MESVVDKELASIRLQKAVELFPSGVQEFSEQVWTAALAELDQAGRACLPRLLPVGPQAAVVTWSTSGVFGPLLAACVEFAENGGRQAAEHVAEEARALKMATTVPHLRHYRDPAPRAGSSPGAVFSHERIGLEGNGFLALPVGELISATGPRKRGILTGVSDTGPEAYAVVWDAFCAPGLVLGGTNLAYVDPGYGIAQLHRQLHMATRALIPGPRDMEWQ